MRLINAQKTLLLIEALELINPSEARKLNAELERFGHSNRLQKEVYSCLKHQKWKISDSKRKDRELERDLEWYWD